MTKTRKSIPRVLPLIWIAAFTAVFAAFIPSLVIAGRDHNTFILSIVIPAMAVVLVLDVAALLLMRRARIAKNSN